MAKNQKLSHKDVGAWVFKGNPDGVWDYFLELADSGRKRGTVDDGGGWTLGSTYRTELIQKGDLVVLWITGSRLPGIHEIGVITGEVEETVIDDTYLIDLSRRNKPVNSVRFKTLLQGLHSPRGHEERSCSVLMRAVPSADDHEPHLPHTRRGQALIAHIPDSALRAAGWSSRLKRIAKQGRK